MAATPNPSGSEALIMCFAVQLWCFEQDAGAAMKNRNKAHFTVVYNRVFSFVLKYVHGYVLHISAEGGEAG